VPREGRVNGNLYRFTPDQLKFIKEELGHLLAFFKYNTEPTNFFPDIDLATDGFFKLNE
jgi:hypothetical protein